MNEKGLLRAVFGALALPALFAVVFCASAQAQGLPSPIERRAPANDCGCPRGDTPLAVSSGMITPFLPKIPNLEFGFLYSFGKNVRTGRFTADYTRPFHLSPNSVLFGEAHAEGWDFWKKPSVDVPTASGFTTTTSSASSRTDLSFGGGYRTMPNESAFLGVNGFYDTSRLFNKWYGSGGVGLEYAAILSGDDAADLNFNWYGNLFNRNVLVNAFRNKGNNFDVEAGYSHALLNHAVDLRLKAVGYQFNIGTPVHGWRSGADLTTRDGALSLRYEYGRDPVNGSYNTVGGFVNVGFQLENLVRGENPFTMPEPLFRSPRNLRRLLGLKVKRNRHQPAAVVVAKSTANSSGPTPTPPKCSNLQGFILVQPTINFYEAYFTGMFPEFQENEKVTLCWCGLRAPYKQIHAQVGHGDYGNKIFYYSLFTPVADTGCNKMRPVVGYYGNWLMFLPALGQPPFEFEPGGGISINIVPQ